MSSAALIRAVTAMQTPEIPYRPWQAATGLRESFHGTAGDYAMAMASLEQYQQMQFQQSIGAIQQTLRGFRQIALAYSVIPGRKTVVWFTTGFPALDLVPDPPPLFGRPGPPRITAATSLRHMGNDLLPAFQEAFAALNRANVVLYPVDLAAFPEDRMWEAWGGGLCYGLRPAAAAWTFGTSCSFDPADSWLQRIGEKIVARSTGGEPCDAGHHLQHCIDAAEADSNSYYLLGFYVPQDSQQAGWHELKVLVGGNHGEVRTRSGYFLEGPDKLPKWREHSALDDAIVAAVEYTGIPFSVLPGQRASAANAPIPFHVSVPASSIVTRPGEDKLSFDIVSIPLTDKGTPVPNAARITNVDMTAAGTRKAIARGWKLIDNATASDAAVAVKVVVRDNATGRIGSVVFPMREGLHGRLPATNNQPILLLDNAAAN